MNGNSILVRVVVIILLLAAPAVGLRILSSLIDAPYLQPLDLTEEGLAAAGHGAEGGRLARIDVHVGWGSAWDGAITQIQLRDTITATLKHQTEFFRVHFDPVPGDRVDVTFVVGPNRYGPYPPDRMAAGIGSALTALRMTNGPEER